MVCVTVKKIGGSYSVIIPARLVREMQLANGTQVEIVLKKKRVSFYGILKGRGLTPWNREEDRIRDRTSDN
jgi:bifunctional DNA-binding transcriptional regulator/antitoxin component of YhaV-PrlF toxin-antitoxin module